MDPLYYNGELIRAEEWDVGPNRLYLENYVYQHLHTFAHKPLHIATHIEILKEATRTVFGGNYARCPRAACSGRNPFEGRPLPS